MSSLRSQLRARVERDPRIDRGLHVFVTAVLTVNIVLILYTVLSLVLKMALAGLDIVDSLPIAFYIVPLIVFLPILVKSYYSTRTGIFNLVVVLVSSVFFGITSILVRGFVILLVLNIITAFLILICGKFSFKGSRSSIGKKGIAWLVLLNALGLLFPASVYIMGQTPIVTVQPDQVPVLVLDVPLADFEFAYQNLTPNSALLTSLENNGFELNLVCAEYVPDSWLKLEQWMIALDPTAIPYDITLVANRAAKVDLELAQLGTSQLIDELFQDYEAGLDTLSTSIDSLSVTRVPRSIFVDMTLSDAEWGLLMHYTRDINLGGVSSVFRSALDQIDSATIVAATTSLFETAQGLGFSCGIIVEPFVVDDYVDRDTLLMKSCGVTLETLGEWSSVAVECSRTSFSLEMLGDVGEYLVHSYSRSIGVIGSGWHLRLGTAGAIMDLEGNPNPVYGNLSSFVDDIKRAAGNGAQRIFIASLQSLVQAFGVDVLSDLRSAVDNMEPVPVTYTFRIYAFRAVMMVIDSFDFIML